MDKFVWLVAAVLQAAQRCDALPASWLPGEYSNTTADAARFLSDYNSTAEEVFFYSVSASWNYNTNLTEYNSQLQVRPLLEYPIRFLTAPRARNCSACKNGAAAAIYLFGKNEKQTSRFG